MVLRKEHGISSRGRVRRVREIQCRNSYTIRSISESMDGGGDLTFEAPLTHPEPYWEDREGSRSGLFCASSVSHVYVIELKFFVRDNSFLKVLSHPHHQPKRTGLNKGRFLVSFVDFEVLRRDTRSRDNPVLTPCISVNISRSQTTRRWCRVGTTGDHDWDPRVKLEDETHIRTTTETTKVQSGDLRISERTWLENESETGDDTRTNKRG